MGFGCAYLFALVLIPMVTSAALDSTDVESDAVREAPHPSAAADNAFALHVCEAGDVRPMMSDDDRPSFGEPPPLMLGASERNVEAITIPLPAALPAGALTLAIFALVRRRIM